MESNQDRFVRFIEKRKSKELLLNGMMETLNIKSGAAYKRINGETSLTANEMVDLAHHFGFSIDTALDSQQFLSFEHPFMGKKSSIDFLDRYAYYLQPLMGSQGDSTLTYMANELPVFYYFSHRYIFNFLISVWNHLHWEEDRLSISEDQYITPQLDFLRKEVSKYYESHPVTEIWNSNMLSNLYQQILFAVSIRAFVDEQYIDRLLRDIEKLILHLKTLAGYNQKNVQNPANIKIYLNEFGNYQNLVLYKSDKLASTFVGFDIPHFVVSYNKNFYDYSKEWIEKIRRRSILISSEGYQYRELFFIKIDKDFEAFKDRVYKLKQVYYN